MRPDNGHVDGAFEAIKQILGVGADVAELVLRERPTMEHALLVLFLGSGIYMYRGTADFSDTAAEFPQIMSGGVIVLSFLLLARNYLQTVAPFLAIFLGLYSLYTGTSSYLADGEGLVRIGVGIVLLVAGTVFREQLGRSTESFVAEPMQVLGKEDVSAGLSADEADGDADTPAVDEGAVDAGERDGVETEVAERDDVEMDAGEPDDVETDVAEPDDVETVDQVADDEPESAAMYVYDIDDPRGPVVTGVLCVVYMLLTFTIGMLYATPLFVLAWAAWVRMSVLETVGLTALSFISAYLFYDLIQSDIAEGWLTGWEPTPPDELIDGIDLTLWVVDGASQMGEVVNHTALALLVSGVTPA